MPRGRPFTCASYSRIRSDRVATYAQFDQMLLRVRTTQGICGFDAEITRQLADRFVEKKFNACKLG